MLGIVRIKAKKKPKKLSENAAIGKAIAKCEKLWVAEQKKATPKKGLTSV